MVSQILENKGHGKAVDWWSMGTLLFEMMAGLPPFYDTNFQRMYKKILSSPLRFPAHLSGDAQDLLKKVCGCGEHPEENLLDAPQNSC